MTDRQDAKLQFVTQVTALISIVPMGVTTPCVVSSHCLRISIALSTLLRIPWIEDTAVQEFSINFITELKALWAEILQNNT